MDDATLVVRLVEALAWPGATVLIACMFRRQLRAVFPLLRKLKAGPFEADFERNIHEIVQEGSDMLDIEETREISGRKSILIQLSQINPSSAIIEAWKDVEISAKKAALQQISTSPPPNVSSPLRAMRELANHEIVKPEDLALFHDLRGLRNQASHLEGFSPSQDSVLEYIDLAMSLTSRLDNLAAPSSVR